LKEAEVEADKKNSNTINTVLNKTSGIDPKLVQKAYAKAKGIKKNKKKSDKGYYPSDKIADKQFDATTRDKGY
jgi:hypothetical protein